MLKYIIGVVMTKLEGTHVLYIKLEGIHMFIVPCYIIIDWPLHAIMWQMESEQFLQTLVSGYLFV